MTHVILLCLLQIASLRASFFCRSTVMTEAELEQEVKRLLGRDGGKL
jgi:hypothetical protein